MSDKKVDDGWRERFLCPNCKNRVRTFEYMRDGAEFDCIQCYLMICMDTIDDLHNFLDRITERSDD